MSNLEEQIMALAAIVQSAHLAQQIAYKGDIPQEDLGRCLHGVLVLDAKSVRDIVGELRDLKPSLRILADIFSKPTGFMQHDEIFQYVLSTMRLERQLTRNKEMLDSIRTSLESLSWGQQQDQPVVINDTTVNELASIYRRTVSKLSGRFQVSGDAKYLKSPYITVKVRAVLFAGIRYAVLWRQLGGRRRQLILQRKQIFHTINKLLEAAY